MSMYQKCLVCGQGFRPNEALEYLDRGRRVAYDPARGRLWQICRSCSRWSLVPIESRWEALEELEKLVADRGRLLSSTDNVALLRAGPLEIVRVGRAELVEEAWWRYGRELRARRERYRKLSTAGTLGAAAAIAGSWATGGMSFLAAWLIWDNAPGVVTGGARWLRFGNVAWRGAGQCRRCGGTIRSFRYRDRGSLIITPGEEAQGVVLSCSRCTDRSDETGVELRGQEANRTLRKVLAYHHFAGASEQRVRGAARLIEVAGGPQALSGRIIRPGRTLGQVGKLGRVALEIAVHEEHERRLLSMQLAELEAHWRREEELAEIMDGSLTPAPLVDSLRRRIAGPR